MSKRQYIVIAGRSYPLRKSKYTSNVSPVCVSDNMSGYVVGQQDIAEFIDQSVDYAREELENENY